MDLRAIGGSSLTSDAAVPRDRDLGAGDIPSTYVPARNTIFLSLALGWAEVLDIRDIVLGVNALDYSGYPDCRPEFMAAFESLASVATRAGVLAARRFTKAFCSTVFFQVAADRVRLKMASVGPWRRAIDLRRVACASLVIIGAASAPGQDDPGKEAFSQIGCVNCHGANAKGGEGPALVPLGRDLKSFTTIVREGSGEMPSVPKEKLSDEQLTDIFKYLDRQSKSARVRSLRTGRRDMGPVWVRP